MSDEARIYHWRRHPESVTGDRTYTTASLADKTLVASACGRLVDYQRAVGDPAESDCPDCCVVATALGEDMS